jgi:hypothetical protein
MATDPVDLVTPVAPVMPVAPQPVRTEPAPERAPVPDASTVARPAPSRAEEPPASLWATSARAAAAPGDAEPAAREPAEGSLWQRPEAPSEPGAGAAGADAPGGTTPPAETGGQSTASPDAAAGRTRELAWLLSIVAPGSGHLYLDLQGPKRSTAFGLLGATVVAVVLAYFSFGLWLIGFLIWAAAAAYALVDLRGSVAGTRLEPRLAALVLAVAGGALMVSLLLPWYHVSIDARGVAAASGNASGLESLDVMDLVLLAIGAAALVLGLATLGRGPVAASQLPPAMPMIVAGGGVLAAVLVFYRMLVDPVPGFGVTGVVDVSIGRAPGILLAGSASIAIVLAAAGALRSSGARSPTA